MLPTLKSASLESKAKGVEGMSYSLTEDKDKFSITESIVLISKKSIRRTTVPLPTRS